MRVIDIYVNWLSFVLLLTIILIPCQNSAVLQYVYAIDDFAERVYCNSNDDYCITIKKDI